MSSIAIVKKINKKANPINRSGKVFELAISEIFTQYLERVYQKDITLLTKYKDVFCTQVPMIAKNGTRSIFDGAVVVNKKTIFLTEWKYMKSVGSVEEKIYKFFYKIQNHHYRYPIVFVVNDEFPEVLTRNAKIDFNEFFNSQKRSFMVTVSKLPHFLDIVKSINTDFVKSAEDYLYEHRTEFCHFARDIELID